MFYVISANKQDFLPYNIEVIVDSNKLDNHLYKITIITSPSIEFGKTNIEKTYFLLYVDVKKNIIFK